MEEDGGAATEVVLGSGQEDKLDYEQTREYVILCTVNRLLQLAIVSQCTYGNK